MNISIIILAAGKGERMKSSLPKILHPLGGIPLLEHVLNTAQKLHPHNIYVVYGSQIDPLDPRFRGDDSGHGGDRKRGDDSERGTDREGGGDSAAVTWIHQEEPLGTGHAVIQTLEHLSTNERILVLYGDVPLISLETLQAFIAQTPDEAIGWLTAIVPNPTGYGRIVKNKDGNPVAIVEEKEATPSQKTIQEINTGICLVPAQYLKSWLPRITNTNQKKEYYLTDIFKIAIQEGIPVHTQPASSESEISGINDQVQLANMERTLQQQLADQYMKQGLRILDPHRFDVRGTLTFGSDVSIDINVILEGRVSIGSQCKIGPQVYLKNVTIGDRVEIKANCVIEDSEIQDDCVVGPFARLRPGTRLAKKASVGNFAEIKNSYIGEGSKVHHVSYIGDTTMGKNVNIGAGTIVCNYDGLHKYPSMISDHAFIGSNSTLLAPVTIGESSYIAAGSVVTHSTPPQKLTIARSRQVTIDHWIPPGKK